MNDADIIKALWCCAMDQMCENCPLSTESHKDIDCLNTILLESLSLIRRYKKKIEILEVQNIRLNKECDNYVDYASKARTEAIKEFADTLKYFKMKHEFPWDDFYVEEIIIDNLVKELTENEQ